MGYKKNRRCPCCGAPLAEELGIKPSVRLGPNQQALFDLLRRHPQGITNEAIRERLFATNRKGDPYHGSIVAVMTHHVNRKIKPWGLAIRGTGGPGSVYQLVQI